MDSKRTQGTIDTTNSTHVRRLKTHTPWRLTSPDNNEDKAACNQTTGSGSNGVFDQSANSTNEAHSTQYNHG